MSEPVFLAAVREGGSWHAADAASARYCSQHSGAACGAVVRLAQGEGGGPQPYRPGEPPQSHSPCPECFWTVAAVTDTLSAALGTLSGLARDVAAAILNEAAPGEGLDPEGPAVQILAHVTRHAGGLLLFACCAAGDCDHDDGGCPGEMTCKACSLQAGPRAGEWAGEVMAGCAVASPCAPLLAIAGNYRIRP